MKKFHKQNIYRGGAGGGEEETAEYMWKWYPMKSFKPKANQEDFSHKNGALILEQLVTSFNGNSLPFRIYSHEELICATNGFDKGRFLQRDSVWTLYKGNHEDRIISVKKFDPLMFEGKRVLDMIINEIAIASQMSNHKNMLKFYGCCIQTELPILVFEHIENGDYARFLSGDDPLLQLESRLRIASELANAITFFHQGTCRIVIHGDVKPKNVFLDDQLGVKLGDFSLSKLIPLGKDHVEGDAQGTFGYIAPESFKFRYTEKSDVYSFGATLFAIITGKNRRELFKHKFGVHLEENLHGPAIMETYLSIDDSRGMEKQLVECAKLTQMCLQRDPDKRPDMLDVAKFLSSIRRHHSKDL